MLTQMPPMGFLPLAPVALGAPEGSVYGNLAVGLIAVLIVVACWLYVRE